MIEMLHIRERAMFFLMSRNSADMYAASFHPP